ncbi:MAG: DNA-protecting protein DprA [Planctomycetes bacterium]|nr:DNA-protecting protein DprA [Planctomycetota bacterium]
MDKLESLLTLTGARGIGSVRYDKLLHHFGSIENVLKASPDKLMCIPGIGEELSREITLSAREKRGAKELEEARKAGVKIITYLDDEYPQNLKTICDYPLVLYVKGELKESDTLSVAVIGSRRASLYGRRQSEQLSYDLAIRGICVVSGLARGIDTHAHMGAVRAKGRTIAVLGSGINNLYPAENKKLAEKITENGAVISELPLDTPPDSRNFPVRNRIISGLSLGILVVEAPLKSGALITVDMALDQGREIFALPGKVDSPMSQGCHKLIKQGAKLVENVDDIIEELNLPASETKRKAESAKTKPTGLNYREETIVNLLSKDEPKHIDEISQESKLSPALVSATLLELELKRCVKQMPGKNFIRLISCYL